MNGYSNTINFGNPNFTLDQAVNGAQYAMDSGMDGISFGGDTSGGALSLTDKFGIGLKGIGALSEILKGFSSMNTNKLLQQQLNMAQDQFSYAKDMSNKNYSNQLKSFNNALSDRSNTRAFVEGRSQQSADDYFNRHKLTGD